MRNRTLLIIIIIVLAAYFLYVNRYKIIISQITIPSEYKGSEGLDYIREHYSTELEQAKSFCIDQFKGNWIDDSKTIGCYDMKNFSIYYCNTDVIQILVNLCNSIEGSSTCSSTQASCVVE